MFTSNHGINWLKWLNWHCFFWSTDDDYNQSATSLPLYRRGVVMELRDVSQHFFYKYEHIQKCTLTNCFIKRRKSKSVDWGLNRCGKTRLKAAPCPLWRIQAPQGVGKASMSPQFLHMAISNFHSQYLRSTLFHHNHEYLLFLVSLPNPHIWPVSQGWREHVPACTACIFHNSKLIYVLWA